MVLQKRLDYGSSGYQFPPMPHVPRSAKGKRSARKKAEANQMCAMDLLATVAKELLETKQSTVAEEFDHETIKRSVLGSDMDCPQTSHTGSGHSSPNLKVELGNSLGTIPEKCSIGRHSPDSRESCKSKFVSGICGMKDPMDVDAKPQALVSSDSSVEVPSSIPKRGEHLDHRDDQEEENSSGCTHPSTLPSKAAFRPQRIGDRRIRKLLASKYWKVAPTMLKDGELSDTEMKPVYRSGRKAGYTRQRTQRGSFKRMKLFERCTLSASDLGMCSEGTSVSPLKRSIKLEASDSHATLHRSGNGESSSSTGQKPSYGATVKFSIKSFKVPELFIEIPETATVASLKRTVVEAVTAILGGGLRVGVLLQGKKVRDDNKTLTQAGISQDNKFENLGFTLEPSPTQSPPSLMSPEDHHPLLLPIDTTEQLTRIPDVVPPADQPEQPPLTTIANCPESDHDSVHSPADVSSPDKMTADSRALVPVPAMNMEALALVPLRKLRRSEMVQRRIRRPFSVTEVEALVQAVEKLGTGRWRDVKLRAFDNAKHRTYVDLKDKWKTLVHTARISPQQRRGEPVPQELLDRVLAAHAFWAQQQAKLQVKPQSGETSCLLL